jgi:hypothetical protein
VGDLTGAYGGGQIISDEVELHPVVVVVFVDVVEKLIITNCESKLTVLVHFESMTITVFRAAKSDRSSSAKVEDVADGYSTTADSGEKCANSRSLGKMRTDVESGAKTAA